MKNYNKKSTFHFLETIKLLNGEIFHLSWHQNRMNATFQHFFQEIKAHQLSAILASYDLPPKGLYKISIQYNARHCCLSVSPYERKVIRRLQFVPVNFSYDFKFADRTNIALHTAALPQSEIIFTHKDFLLDSTCANLALFDGEHWITPTTFLLNGTTRRRLLHKEIIIEKPLKQQDISSFEKISFLNALNDLGEWVLSINAIED